MKRKLLSSTIALFMVAALIVVTYVSAFGTSLGLEKQAEIRALLGSHFSQIVNLDKVVDYKWKENESNKLTFKLSDGSTTVYTFSEDVLYRDNDGQLKCKDMSIDKQSDKTLKKEGYTYSNGDNSYSINFSKDADKGVKVSNDGNYGYTLSAKSDIKTESTGTTSQVKDDIGTVDVFDYNNAYGEGTLLRYYPQLNGVKDEIILDKYTGQNKFDYVLNTTDCYPEISDDGSLLLINKETKKTAETFAPIFAYDAKGNADTQDEHYTNDCSYSLQKINDSKYILSINVSKDFLTSENTVYPVTIDPTTSNISMDMDTYISSNFSISCSSMQTNIVGYSSGTSRILAKFSIPSSITSGATINSAYYWAKEMRGSGSIYASAYMVTSSWDNSTVWSTAPTYSSTKLCTKYLNSNSTDNPSDNTWYKFDITSAVSQWKSGTTNNGILIKSDDETLARSKTLASMEYGVSSYRPYTVINYTIDTTAPTATSVTGNPTDWTSSSVNLTVNGATDETGLSATPYSFSTTQGVYNWQASNVSPTYTSNQTIYVYLRDNAGNIALISTQNITKIDKTAPTITSVTGNPTSWTNQNVTLVINGASDSSSGLNTYPYSFSTTQGVYNWQTSNTATFSSNGTVYIYVRDAAGNISLASTQVINNIDPIAPSISGITENPSSWTNGSVTLTVNDAIDTGGSGLSATPYSFSTTAGVYNWQASNVSSAYSSNQTVYIYVRDNAGNIASYNSQFNNIDKTAPTITNVTGNPTSWTNEDVTLTVTADDSESGANATPYSFSTIQGVYNWQASNSATFSTNQTVYIYARDTAGNISLCNTQVISKTDKTAPTITSVTGNPTAWTNGNVTLTVNGAADSESGLNATAYSFSTTQGEYNWQASNVATFSSNQTVYIYVRDALGNISLVSTQTIDKIDKVAPTITSVTGNPTDWTNQNITLAVNGATDSGSGLSDTPYSFSTTVGEYNWQASNVSPTYSSNQTIYVYVRDAAGNIILVSTQTINKIDKTAPTITDVTNNPTSWTNEGVTLTVNGAADGQSGLSASAYSFSTVDGVYNWQTSNTATFSNNITVYVYVRDALGNIALVSTQTINNNDNISPTITDVTGNPTSWTNGDVTLTVTANDIDSGLNATPYSFSTIQGEYNWQASNTATFSSNQTVYVYVRDVAGNISLVSTQTIDKIDKTAPTITDATGNPTSWTNEDVILTVNGAADGQSGLSSTAYSFSTTEGVYNWQASNTAIFSSNQTVYVYVRDAAGNISLVSAQIINSYDNTTPIITDVTGNPTSWTNGDVILTVNGATDGQSGLSSTPYSFSTTEGVYNWQESNTAIFSSNQTVYVYVRDVAGNISLVSTQIIDKIDKTAPIITDVTGNQTSWTNGDVTLTVNGATDGQSGLSPAPYSFSNSESVYNWQASNTATFSSNQTVYVYVRDAAGNISLVSTQTIDKIDKTAPRITDVTGNQTSWINGGVTLTVNGATDGQSGLSSTPYSFSTNQGVYNWQTSNTATFNSNQTVYIYVCDAAGNISLVSTQIIDKIDKTAPTITNVTVNTSSNSGTLTINGASDNQSGLNDNPYSFSTTENVYSWQESNTATFSLNQFIYVYVRDAAGNIALCSAQNVAVEDYTLTYTLSADGTYYTCMGITILGPGVTSITIPTTYNGLPVKAISASAFKNRTTLTNITIPSSVTSIGSNAFYGCTSLTSINIPSSVISIGNNTFKGCTALTSVTIQDSVTSIGESAFEGCTSLTSVTIPSSVTTMENNVFKGCTSLTSAIIQNGLTSIGDNAFYGCTSLTSIVIPGSTLYIGSNAFYGCTSLISATIQNGVTSIRDAAFWGCTSLTEITIPSSVSYIGSYTFFQCTSLTSVTNQSSATSIGSYAFAACTALTSITIPNGVTSIGDGAFYGCTASTSITIPNSVTTIGMSAFAGCTSITDITIPSSVTSIGNQAFAMCTSLVSINIPNGITVIGNSFFQYCTSLTSVTLPGSVTLIGESAFEGCQALTSIIIPNNVTTIGNNAFNNCTSLTGVIIPSSVTSIGYQAFAMCTSLTGVTIPNSVSSIGYGAFYGCAALTAVTIPSSLTSISNGTFGNCTSLINVTIPNNVTSIGENAFNGCTALTSITIPSSVSTIGYSTFYGCTSLTDVTIQNGVTYIGDYAFKNCSSLTDITIPSSVTSIGYYAFNGCTALTSVILPSSVTTYNYAFDSSTSVISVTGNPTEWANSDVTLTINGVTPGNGFSSTPYSFSTSEGQYIWQASNTATYSSNQTIYIYLFDANGNIISLGTQVIRIETTVPTITDITGNPTSWATSATLTINGASDTGGSGLSSTPYSFSTEQGVYNWQSSNTATFSTNVTVYIYVRDVAGNILYYGSQTIDKIDATTPTITDVTEDTTDYITSTLTINGATDSESGLNTTAYSFSTTRGIFNWQSSNSATFNSNKKVYIYVRDALGNILYYGYQTIEKVDTKAPTITGVTSSSSTWTKGPVTLTVEGASDNASGLNTAPYSFSSAPEEYNWQASNVSPTYDSTQLVYVYVRDALSNQTLCTVIYANVDNIAPTFSVSGNPTSLTNDDVTLVINSATDGSGSGLSDTPYSFSTSEGVYNWQALNYATFSSNGTIYVYTMDKAGNITCNTVTIDKIDKTCPTLTNISSSTDESGNITLNVSASDTGSGIKEYSFDNGATWQTSNVCTVGQSITGLKVKIKDNAGNIGTYLASDYSLVDDSVPNSPIIYEENNLVTLLNQGKEYISNGSTALTYDLTLQYKIGDGDWTDYTAPFEIAQFRDITVYARAVDSSGNISYITQKTFESTIGEYTESVTDFSTDTYRNLPAFDFSRSYNSTDAKWFYSINSNFNDSTYSYLDSNGNLQTTTTAEIKVITMPNGNKYSFVKQNGMLYKNAETGWILQLDSNGYILFAGDLTYGFDSNGKLSYITNKYSETITFTRTNSSITVSVGSGYSYVANLDSNGNITTITDGITNKVYITYAYDSNGKLDTVTDATNVVTSSYDYTSNILTKSSDKTIGYTNGFVTSETLDNGQTTLYSYDFTNNRIDTYSITSESSSGLVSSIIYDNRLNTVSSTDESGNIATYTYHVNGKVASYSCGSNSSTYDENGNILTETDGTTTYTYVYDSDGNITSITSSTGKTQTFSYANGKLIREKDEDGNYTYYTYDTRGNVFIKATLKDSYTGTAPESYTHSNNIFNIIVYRYESVNGNDVTTAYNIAQNSTQTDIQDSSGNLVSSSVTNLPGTTTTTYTYDQFNQVLTCNDGTSTISYVYDGAGRTIRVTLDGKSARYLYDSKGRLKQQIGSDVYDSTKDGLNNLTPTNTYSDSTAGQNYTYASNGKLSSDTNNGITTSYTYDSYGHVISKSFDIYTINYTSNGNISSVVMGTQTLVTNTYNDNNNLTSTTYANGQSIHYVYYDLSYGETAKYVYYNNETIPRYVYVYDENGELTQVYEPANSLDMINGIMTEYEDGAVLTCLIVDSMGTPIHGYYFSGEDASLLTERALDKLYYTYYCDETAVSNLERLDQIEAFIGTEFNSMDEFILNLDSDEQVIEVCYSVDGSGNTTEINVVLNGVYTDTGVDGTIIYSVSYAYTNKKVTTETHTLNGSTETINYTYENNNIKTVTRNGVTTKYYYDSNSQLVRVDDGEQNKTISYSYDSRGNILSKSEYGYTTANDLTGLTPSYTISYLYEDTAWSDKLTSYNGNTISYDELGNRTSYNGWTYTWEGGRLLTGMTNTNGTTINYKYDADGIRTSKTVNGVTTKYTTIDGRITSQTDGTNSLYFRYDCNDELFGVEINGTNYIYVKNIQGDIIAITDINGTIVVEYTYDAWGNVTSITGSLASTVGQFNPMRYRGYYYDAETGYYYLQSRYYESTMGRFINSDEPYLLVLGKSFGTNLFVYCINNPVNFSDPTGKYTESLTLAKPLITALSEALAGLVASISASMSSVETAIATSWIPAVCIAAATVAVGGIVYTVKKAESLNSSAKKTIAAVKAKVKAGGINKKNLKNNTVYVIVRKGTTDVIYVGRTCNFNSRAAAHKKRFPESSFTIYAIATNLTLAKARAMEQTIITAYTLDTLWNMINSISPSKWDTFQREFSQMQTLIESFYDPE